MSDRQNETNRKGMSTLLKVLLIGGGVVATLVIVVVVLGVVGMKRLLEESPEFFEELGETIESAAIVSLGDVSKDFGRVVSEAATVMLVMEGMRVEQAGEGSGVTFNIHPRDGGSAVGFDLVSVSEMLDKVGSGEMYFGDVGLEETMGDDDAEDRLPDWVPLFPGGRRNTSVFTDLGDVTFGVEVVLADASAQEVLDWYKESVGDIGLTVRTSSSVSTHGRQPPEETTDDTARHGHVSAGSGDRRLLVMVAEDERRDSFFVILYRE